MFDDFTNQANNVLLLAQQEAYRLNHNFVGVENILLGLVEEPGIAADVLQIFGINSVVIRSKVDELIGRGSGAVGEEIPFTPSAKKMLANARHKAYRLGQTKIDTEHLLLELVSDTTGVACQILQELNVDIEKLNNQIMSYTSRPDIQDNLLTASLHLEENLAQKIQHLMNILNSAKQLISDIEAEVTYKQTISYADVVNIIHQAPVAIKHLLDKLYQLIESDSLLSLEDKRLARSELVVLAVASQSEDEYCKSRANIAIKVLIGTVVQRPKSDSMLTEYRTIFPAISKYFRS